MPEFSPSVQDDDNRSAATGRLLNCYRQVMPWQDRTRYTLKSVLGTEPHVETGGVGFQAATDHKKDLYTVLGGVLYRVSASGVVVALGSVSFGDTSISSNGDSVTVAAGGSFFVWDGGTVQRVLQTAFSGVGSVDYLDQRTLVTERGGNKWAWSEVADPQDFPGLNFSSADGEDDSILRILGLNGRVVIFKEKSREVWYNTGQSGANAFARVAGGVRQVGLKSYGLLTRTEDGVFFIGSDNIARLTMDGLSAQKIPHPPLETSLEQGQPTECFFYEDEGQKFCVVRFADRPSWVLDLASGEWHERAEGPQHDPWCVRGAVDLGGAWYTVNNLGQVWRLTRNNTDVSGALRRTAISPTQYYPNRATVDLIEIYGRTGYSDLGRNAEIMLRLSRDGGDTWTEEKRRSMGTVGGHPQRMTWRRQGLARQLTIEASITDAAELPIWSDFQLVTS